jgi:uncharacterized membrane protein YbhN (UPF0104 family)
MVVFSTLTTHAVGYHALCLALVVADVIARSYRIAFVLKAMHSPIPMLDAYSLTLFGDAAAALTPWRIAGEPARVLGATHANASATTSVVALGVESLVNYFVLTVIGIVLASAFGAEWATVLHGSTKFLTHRVTIVVSVLVVLFGIIAFTRLPPHIIRRAREFVSVAAYRLRRIGPHDIGIIAALSVISLLSRIAILPIVVAAFDEQPPFGVVSLASFALLNGQILAPTPSGAGAVELAATSGFIGVKEHTGAILTTWRLYVTILPIIAGLLCATFRYGPRALLIILRRREES